MSVVFSSDEFVILDEAAYFDDVFESLDVRMNRTLFEINGRFMMDSEFEAKNAVPEVHATKRKRKRKRAPVGAMNQECEVMAELAKQVKVCGQETGIFRVSDVRDNNRRAREIAKQVLDKSTLLHPEGLVSSSQVDDTSLIGNSCFNSWVENAGPSCQVGATLSQQEFVLHVPSESTFHVGDVADVVDFCFLNDKVFDLVVMDPPWENRSVKRNKSYVTNEYILDKINMEMLQKDGVLAVWLTNKTGLRDMVDEYLKDWGFHVRCDWTWLKMLPWHKVPFETLLIANRKPAEESIDLLNSFPKNFVFASVPMAIHSHKPPLLGIFEHFNFHPKRRLELFARSLLPGTTSVGFEPLLLQTQDVFCPRSP